MSLDNEIFSDDLLDPILDTDATDKKKPSAPRIEKDLAKLGSLEAISQRKKDLEEKERSARLSDLSSEPQSIMTVPKDNSEPESEPETETKPPQASRRDEYIYGDGEKIIREPEKVPDRNFSDLSVESIKLVDMNEKYLPTHKSKATNEELASKTKLDIDEKALIKERLKNEIGVRPEGYDQKASLNMYKSLMAERRIESARKGLGVNIFLILLGFGCAYIALFHLSKDVNSKMAGYAGIGSALFSALLLFKSKVSKSAASVYFIINTALLIIEGVSKYILAEDVVIEIMPIVFLGVSLLFSVIIFVQLLTNNLLKTYFVTNFAEEKKKIVKGNAAKSS